MEYKTPFEDLLPPLSDNEYQALKDDIAQRGILVPVVLDENNNVIDGHHRLRIASELLLDDYPRDLRTDLSWKDKGLLAWHLNAHRRNMTAAQRTEAALKLEKRLAEEAKERQRQAGGDRKSDEYKKSVPQNSAEPIGETRDKIAKMANVSHDTVDKMKKIVNDAPDEIKEAVRSGNISIHCGEALTRALNGASDKVCWIVAHYVVVRPEVVAILKRLEKSQGSDDSNGTFDEILASGYIQPGEDYEAVHITATVKEIEKALKTKVSIHLEEQRKHKASAVIAMPSGTRWNMYHDDIQTWIAPRKYDYIITDPPYKKEYLYLYDVLGRRACDWLIDGGLLVVMCGQSYLDQIYTALCSHLAYYWTAAYLTPGQPTPLRQRQVNTSWKPILIFSNGEYKGKTFGDVFKSDANDKKHHKWGQSESGMSSIVAGICEPGGYILDPFCGAATTGIAALDNNCLFDGIEVDDTNYRYSVGRLSDHDTSTQ